MKVALLSLLSAVIFLPYLAIAAPVLYNPLPVNNSFFSGGEITFNINITEGDLNSSSVTVHLIALDAYRQNESWVNYTMSCTNYTASNWNCSKKLTIFSLVGSDTIELFYFDAKDNSGNIGANGTANETHALRFTLDRKLPIIRFVNPTNGTWVSGIEMIEIDVVDDSSGVNQSTVNYSFDRIQWFNTTKATYYNSIWNTTTLTNNQTVIIYARASDNVNNTNETNINVTVDNEVPKLEILSPTQNQNLNSTAQFRINVSDVYSGIKTSSVSFSVGGISESMDCTGTVNYTCTKLFDTFRLSDGTYIMNFSVSDIAGNINLSSISITVSNKKTSIRITEPPNNSYVKGTVLFRASLADPTNVNYVKLVTEKEEKNMSCTTDFSGCTVNLDTTQYQDGTRNISVKAISASREILTNSSIVLIFDNTKPQLNVKYPDSPVNGTFTIDANVTDEFPDKDKIVFQVGSFSNYMSCTKESEKKLICKITFDSGLLTNGLHNMTVSATDLVGNQISVSKEIKVSNAVLTSGKNETEKNETGKNKTGTGFIQTGQNIIEKLSTPKTFILFGLLVIAILIVILYRRRKLKQEKPWYETIGRVGEQ